MDNCIVDLCAGEAYTKTSYWICVNYAFLLLCSPIMRFSVAYIRLTAYLFIDAQTYLHTNTHTDILWVLSQIAAECAACKNLPRRRRSCHYCRCCRCWLVDLYRFSNNLLNLSTNCAPKKLCVQSDKVLHTRICLPLLRKLLALWLWFLALIVCDFELAWEFHFKRICKHKNSKNYLVYSKAWKIV